jgi:hypothetical protein
MRAANFFENFFEAGIRGVSARGYLLRAAVVRASAMICSVVARRYLRVGTRLEQLGCATFGNPSANNCESTKRIELAVGNAAEQEDCQFVTTDRKSLNSFPNEPRTIDLSQTTKLAPRKYGRQNESGVVLLRSRWPCRVGVIAMDSEDVQCDHEWEPLYPSDPNITEAAFCGDSSDYWLACAKEAMRHIPHYCKKCHSPHPDNQ